MPLDIGSQFTFFTQQERAILPRQPRQGLRANRFFVSSSSETSSSPASQASQASRAILPRPQRQGLLLNRSPASSSPASQVILPKPQRPGLRANRSSPSSSSETSSSQASPALSLRF